MKNLTPGVMIANKYRLTKPLTSGGMGALWVAVHLDLNIEVAIKFPDPDLVSDPDSLIRFRREAQSAASLRSRHVVEIKDYGVDEGMPYIVMELLRGEDLLMRNHRQRFSIDQTVDMLRQITAALSEAHSKNIIHRDLKPENIFYTSDSAGELVKIIDFGIAKWVGHTSITSKGAVIGTPAYMSPEQLGTELPLTPQSDLWSLGAVLFEVLSGRRLFSLPPDLFEAITARITARMPDLPSIAPELPRQFIPFFQRALATDPSERFPSAEAMFEAYIQVVVDVTDPLRDLQAAGTAPTLPGGIVRPRDESVPLPLVVRRPPAESTKPEETADTLPAPPREPSAPEAEPQPPPLAEPRQHGRRPGAATFVTALLVLLAVAGLLWVLLGTTGE